MTSTFLIACQIGNIFDLKIEEIPILCNEKVKIKDRTKCPANNLYQALDLRSGFMKGSKEIKIKPLSTSDAERAAEIYNQSLQYLSREKEISEEKMKEFITENKEFFLGAYLNNLLVGHLLLKKEGEKGLDIGIVIDPKYQGKKIGSRLIKKGIKLARSKNYKKLVVDILEYNSLAIKFFEKNGFKKTGFSKRTIVKKGKKTKLLRYAYNL